MQVFTDFDKLYMMHGRDLQVPTYRNACYLVLDSSTTGNCCYTCFRLWELEHVHLCRSRTILDVANLLFLLQINVATSLCAGGETGIFSPMHLLVFYKPEDSKSNWFATVRTPASALKLFLSWSATALYALCWPPICFIVFWQVWEVWRVLQ